MFQNPEFTDGIPREMLHVKMVFITHGREILVPVVFGAQHSWPDADFSYELNHFV